MGLFAVRPSGRRYINFADDDDDQASTPDDASDDDNSNVTSAAPATLTRAPIAPAPTADSPDDDPEDPLNRLSSRMRARQKKPYATEMGDPLAYQGDVRAAFRDEVQSAQHAQDQQDVFERVQAHTRAVAADRADQQAKLAAAAEAKQAGKDLNSAREADFRTRGVSHYTDANGQIQPDKFEDGSTRFVKKPGEVQYDEQTGDAFRMDRDEHGLETRNDLDVNSPIGTHPTRLGELYRQDKQSGWNYLGTVDDGLKSSDPNVQAAAVKAQTNIDKHLHGAARTGFKGALDQVSADELAASDSNVAKKPAFDAIQQQIRDAQAAATATNFLGQPKPEAAAARASLPALQQQLKDLGYYSDPAQMKAAFAGKRATAQKSFAAFNADVAKSGFDTAEDNYRQRVAAAGGDPDTDPVLATIAKTRADAGLPTVAEKKLKAAQQAALKDPSIAPAVDDYQATTTKAADEIRKLKGDYDAKLDPLRQQVAQGSAQLQDLKAQEQVHRQAISQATGLDIGPDDDLSTKLGDLSPADFAKAQPILASLSPILNEQNRVSQTVQPVADQLDAGETEANTALQAKAAEYTTVSQQKWQTVQARIKAANDAQQAASSASEADRFGKIDAATAEIDAAKAKLTGLGKLTSDEQKQADELDSHKKALLALRNGDNEGYLAWEKDHPTDPAGVVKQLEADRDNPAAGNLASSMNYFRGDVLKDFHDRVADSYTRANRAYQKPGLIDHMKAAALEGLERLANTSNLVMGRRNQDIEAAEKRKQALGAIGNLSGQQAVEALTKAGEYKKQLDAGQSIVTDADNRGTLADFKAAAHADFGTNLKEAENFLSDLKTNAGKALSSTNSANFLIQATNQLPVITTDSIHIDESNMDQVAKRNAIREAINEQIGEHYHVSTLAGSALGSLGTFMLGGMATRAAAGKLATMGALGKTLKEATDAVSTEKKLDAIAKGANYALIGSSQSFKQSPEDMGVLGRFADMAVQVGSLAASEALGESAEHKLVAAMGERKISPLLKLAAHGVASGAGETISDVTQDLMGGDTPPVLDYLATDMGIGVGMALFGVKSAAKLHMARKGLDTTIAGMTTYVNAGLHNPRALNISTDAVAHVRDLHAEQLDLTKAVDAAKTPDDADVAKAALYRNLRAQTFLLKSQSDLGPLSDLIPSQTAKDLGAIDTTDLPKRMAAIDQQFVPLQDRFKAGDETARPELENLAQQRFDLLNLAKGSHSIAAAADDIDNLDSHPQFDGASPGQLESTKNAARGIVKIALGHPMEALTAAERTAVETPRTDGSNIPRVEMVNDKPVITQKAIDNLKALAPNAGKLIGQNESERRQAILADAKAAEDAKVNPPAPAASSPAAGAEAVPKDAPTVLREEMHKQLGALGYSEEQRNALKPAEAADIIRNDRRAGPSVSPGLGTYEVQVEGEASPRTVQAASVAAARKLVSGAKDTHGFVGVPVLVRAPEAQQAPRANAPAATAQAGATAAATTEAPKDRPFDDPEKEAFYQAALTDIKRERGGRELAPHVAAQLRGAVEKVHPAVKRWEKAFDSVGWQMASMQSGGLAVKPHENKLVFSLKDILAEHEGFQRGFGEHGVTEEAVHAVSEKLHDEGQINLDTIWAECPEPLRQAVRSAYPLKGDSAATDYAHSREFWRMLIQGHVNLGAEGWNVDGKPIVTEQVTPSFLAKIRGALAKLFNAFVDMRTALKAEGAGAEYIAEVERAQKLTLARVKEIDAFGKKGVYESPSKTSGEDHGHTAASPEPVSNRPAPVAASAPPANAPGGVGEHEGDALGSVRPDRDGGGTDRVDQPVGRAPVDSVEWGGERVALAGEWQSKNPRGSEVFKGRWALVPLRLLQVNTQHGAAQDRIDREKTGAAQRLEIIGNVTPENVGIAWGASPSLSDGAPIVSPEGSVEVGNNRTLALRDMANTHPEKAALYDRWARAEAGRLGLDEKAHAGEPVALVRVDDGTRGGLTQKEFVAASNTAGTEQRSVAETALADRSVFATGALLDSLEPNDDGSFNAAFLHAFYHAAGSPKELRFEDGKPDTGKIERRAQAALLAHLLGTQPGVDRILSSLMDNLGTPGIRQVVSALAKSGPALLRIDSVNPELTITPSVGRALTALLDYRRSKERGDVRSVDDYRSQGSLFAGDDRLPHVLDGQVLNLFAEARSVKALSDRLLRYAKAVEEYGHPDQTRFFQEAPPNASDFLATQRQSVAAEQQMLWNVSEKEQGTPPKKTDTTTAGWARAYRTLFAIEKSGRTLDASQRALMDKAEQALGQRLMFGDEVRGTPPLSHYRDQVAKARPAQQEHPGELWVKQETEQSLLLAQRQAPGLNQLDFGIDNFGVQTERGQQPLFRHAVNEKRDTTPAYEKQTLPEATDTKAPPVQPELLDGPEPTVPSETAIGDFGEKIGGARKDTAKKLGPRDVNAPKSVDQSDAPAWQRKYAAVEETKWGGYGKPPVATGKWTVERTDSTRVRGAGSFDTQAEAAASIPLVEFGRNHGFSPQRDPATGATTWAIYRRVGEHKRPIVKTGFASEHEAKQYAATHPEELIEHRFPFPVRPWLDRLRREGGQARTGDVTPKNFQDAFGFRGGEFGNWNMGGDGQAALNHAYDALHDFAEILGVSPKALSLNGELAIAFGARGTGGVDAASAHYEPGHKVINLTKIRGSGSLAHEWFHALDHALGRQDGKGSDRLDQAKASGRDEAYVRGEYVSHGFSRESGVREQLRDAFNAVMAAATARTVERDVPAAELTKAADRQGEYVKQTLTELRQSLENGWTYSKKKQAPTAAQLAEFDRLAAKITAGDVGERIHVETNGGSRLSMGRESFQPIEELNALYKGVLGRSFAASDENSRGKRLFWQVRSMLDARARVATAGEAKETRRIATDFLREARKIDDFRASNYWSTPHEMGARAFESFVADKLAKSARRNEYLVHGTDNGLYAALNLKPYPEGSERETLNTAWQKLFDTIEQRETPRGTMLRSQPQALRGVDPAQDAAYTDDREQHRRNIAGAISHAEAYARGVGSTGAGERSESEATRSAISAGAIRELDSDHLQRSLSTGSLGVNLGRHEHDVYVDPVAGRVIKVTTGDGFGFVAAGEHGTLPAYLRRLELLNHELDDDLAFEGVLRNPETGNYRAVISQPFIKGRNATPQEIEQYFKAKGFDRYGASGFWHTGREFGFNDAQSVNVLMGDDGRVYPIDVIPQTDVSPRRIEHIEALVEGWKRQALLTQPQNEKRERLSAANAQERFDAFDEDDPSTWPRDLADKTEGFDESEPSTWPENNQGLSAFDPEDWDTWDGWDTPEDERWMDENIQRVGEGFNLEFDANTGRYADREKSPAGEERARRLNTIMQTAKAEYARREKAAVAEYARLKAEAIRRHADLEKQLDNTSFLFTQPQQVTTAGERPFHPDHAAGAFDTHGLELFDRLTPSQQSAAVGLAHHLRTATDHAAADAHPDPTDPQKEAGNYRMGHARIAGLDITLENQAGSVRSGQDAAGKAWSVTMGTHYGYIRGTEGKDGDHVDALIKPGTPEDWSGTVYIVNQPKANGHFDEHKAVFGAGSEAEARQLYLSNYSSGWQAGPITAMPMAEFREWLKNGDQTKPAVATGGWSSEGTPADRVKNNLRRAEAIAAGFNNTPGVEPADVRQVALRGLVKAARAFKTEKGSEFGPFASTAIRNELLDFYRQRASDRNVPTLDEPLRGSDGAPTGESAASQLIDANADVPREVSYNDASRLLDQLIAEFGPNIQATLNGIRDGKTFEEIGEDRKVTKQGAFNLSKAALEKLRRKLAEHGVRALDDVMLAMQPQAERSAVETMMDLLDSNELDPLREQAAAEAPGAFTIGRPDLALGARDSNVRAVDESMKRNPEKYSTNRRDILRAEAESMLARDYEGTANKLVEMATNGEGHNVAETLASQIILNHELSLPQTVERSRRIQALTTAHRLAGHTASENLSARRDMNRTPAQRAQLFLNDFINGTKPKLVRQIVEAKSDEEKQRLLDRSRQDSDRLKEELRKQGVDIDDILSGEVEMRLKGAPIVDNIVATFDQKRQQAFKLLQGGTKSFAEVAKEVKLSPKEVEAVRDAFVAEFRKKHFEKFAKGATAEQLDVAALKAQSQAGGEVPAEQAEAEFQRALKMMGIVPKESQGKYKVAKRPRRSRAGTAAPFTGQLPSDRPVGEMPNRQNELLQPGRNADRAPTGTSVFGEATPRQGDLLNPERNADRAPTGLSETAEPANKQGDLLNPERNADRAPTAAPVGEINGKQAKLELPYEEWMYRRELDEPEQLGRIAGIAQAASGGVFDMLQEYWINSILSGPATHIANIAGNLASTAWDFSLQRGMEAFVNLFWRDKDSAQFGEFKYILRGVLPGVVKGLALARKCWNAEADLFKQSVLDQQVEMFTHGEMGQQIKPAIAGTKGRVIRMPGRSLLFMDAFFKRSIAQMEAGAQAYRIAKGEGLKGSAMEQRMRELVNTPGSPAWTRAVDKAIELTFQKESVVGELFGKGKALRNDPRPAAQTAGYLLSYLFPFINTPYNIFKTGVRKTPLGAFNILARLGHAGIVRIKDGKAFTDSYSKGEQVKHVSELILGFLAMAALRHMAEGDPDDDDKKWLITGSVPMNETSAGERALKQRAFGGSYMMRIGGRNGRSFNYGRYEPAATVLGTMVDTLRALKKNGTSEDKWDSALGYFVAQAQAKTFLQSEADMVKALQDGKGFVDSTKRALLQSLVPNLIRQPLRNLDEWQRDAKGGGPQYDILPTGGNASPKIDVYGNPVEKAGSPLSRLFFAAGTKTAPVLADVDRLLLKWNALQPAEKWAPAAPDRHYNNSEGKSVEMTGPEYEQFSRRAGELASAKLEGSISEDQISYPSERDVSKIRAAFTAAHKEAKAEMFPEARRRRPVLHD